MIVAATTVTSTEMGGTASVRTACETQRQLVSLACTIDSFTFGFANHPFIHRSS